MIVLRDPKQLTQGYAPLPADTVTTPQVDVLLASLRLLLQQRMADLAAGAAYDPDEHGYLIVAEPGDTAKALEAASGCPILSGWFGDSHYGEIDFAPACEWLDEYLLFYELGFVTNDSGTTTLVIVPKLNGVDCRLLAMCRDYAEVRYDTPG